MLAVSLIGLIVAPSLQLAPEGLWQLIRKFSGFYNIPLIAIVLAAYSCHGPPARRLWAWFYSTSRLYRHHLFLGFWYPLYPLVRHFVVLDSVHWRYLQSPRPNHTNHQLTVDLTPWRYRWWVVGSMALHHCLVCAAVTDRHCRLVIAEHRFITLSVHSFAPCPWCCDITQIPTTMALGCLKRAN